MDIVPNIQMCLKRHEEGDEKAGGTMAEQLSFKEVMSYRKLGRKSSQAYVISLGLEKMEGGRHLNPEMAR